MLKQNNDKVHFSYLTASKIHMHQRVPGSVWLVVYWHINLFVSVNL